VTSLLLKEVAAELRKSERWLRDWLARNPQDAGGRPYWMQMGRTKTFLREDVGRIALAIIQEEADQDRPAIQDGLVYFIDGGDWVKIGFTRSERARIKKMSTDAPVELKFLHAEPGTFKQEKLFHREFADLRTRGEWFRKDDRLLAFIKQRKAILEGRGGLPEEPPG
jgi:hypothetical protein